MVRKSRPLRLEPERLMQRLADITIHEAKQILETLAPEYLRTQITSVDWAYQTAKRPTTFITEYEVVWNHYDFATDVKVEFAGGPPGNCVRAKGSLLMYVVDRILYHASVYKPQSVMRVLKPYGFTMERNHGKRCADGSYVQVQ